MTTTLAPIVLHGLTTCETCRTARARLRGAGREVILRDLRAQPPGAAEIARWHAVLGPDLLNRRSATWRQLSEADRAREPETLMAAHPALIKRPVIDADGLLLGWSAATRAALGL